MGAFRLCIVITCEHGHTKCLWLNCHVYYASLRVYYCLIWFACVATDRTLTAILFQVVINSSLKKIVFTSIREKTCRVSVLV